MLLHLGENQVVSAFKRNSDLFPLTTTGFRCSLLPSFHSSALLQMKFPLGSGVWRTSLSAPLDHLVGSSARQELTPLPLAALFHENATRWDVPVLGVPYATYTSKASGPLCWKWDVTAFAVPACKASRMVFVLVNFAFYLLKVMFTAVSFCHLVKLSVTEQGSGTRSQVRGSLFPRGCSLCEVRDFAFLHVTTKM